MDRRTFTALLAASAAAGTATAQTAGTAAPIRNVVLVHGAFADASGYNAVIAELQSSGLTVIGVQNPLTSLADDVAATHRALNRMDGPTVLVGHSWGGAVITEAGTHDKVAALVYLAAFAPDAGESLFATAGDFPHEPGTDTIEVADGYGQLSIDGYMTYFAPDVPEAERRVAAATQGPVSAALFESTTANAAWSSRPSWYAVATQDRMLNAEWQRSRARYIGATIVDVEASHALAVSQPQAVADLIRSAAAGRSA